MCLENVYMYNSKIKKPNQISPQNVKIILGAWLFPSPIKNSMECEIPEISFLAQGET